MFEIQSNPPAISLAGMPLKFTVFSDTVADFYKIQAVPFPADDDAATEIKPRSSGGHAIFDLSEYFIPKRVSGYSDLNSAVHSDACKESVIEFNEYYGNPPEASNTIFWTGNILGGTIPRWKHHSFFKTYASFSAYLTAAKPFLTWYPRQAKKVLPAQPERLYWLNTSSATPATLKLITGVYFDDDTFVLYDTGRTISANPNKVVSFATGYNQLGLEAWAESNHPGKTITYYYCQLMISSTAVSEAFLYRVDRNEYRNTRYIIFRNSIFGYDCLACTGEIDEITEVDRLTAGRVADVSDATRLHRVEYRNEEFQGVKINTGWLETGEKNWLSDLFISPEIYEVVDGQRVRILMKSKQLDRSEKGFAPGDVELEYERLFLAI